MTTKYTSTQPKLTIEQLHRGFFLGEIAIKPESGVVIRDGEGYKLPPKAMLILVFLAANQCQIRTRQQIVAFGWGNSSVSSNNITHIISDIRHALGDIKGCPRFVQTIPKKGYRMMISTSLQPVKYQTSTQNSEQVPPISINVLRSSLNRILNASFNTFPLKYLILLLALFISFIIFENFNDNKELEQNQTPVTALHQEPIKHVTDNAIAILLFTKLDDSKNTRYILPSLQEELVESLTHHPEFQVASIRATNDLGSKPSVEVIRNRLKVKFILDGSVSHVDQNISISMNLINSITGFQVWSGKSSGNINQLLTVNKDLTRKLINGLKLLGLGENINQQENGTVPTTSFLAYDYYLQGKEIYRNKKNTSSLIKAETLFKTALQHDSGFMLANSALCTIYMELYSNSNDIQYFNKGVDICKQAENSGQASAEANLALSRLYNVTGRYQQAKEILLASLIKFPNNPQLLITLANVFANLKDTSSARQYFLKAITSEPAYWRNHHEFGLFLFKHGEYEQAISYFKRSIGLNNNFSESYNALGGAYFLTNNFDQANIAWSKALAIETTPTTLTNLATSLFFLKQYDNAIQIYLQAIELNPFDSVIWANLGDAYKYAQQIQKAQDSFKKALELAQNQEQINPKDLSIQSQIGRYYSEIKQCSNANVYKETLLSKTLNDPYIFYDLALLAINCKQMLQAEGLLKKAVENGYQRSLLEFDPQFGAFKDLL